ncbi:hypothetical protein ZEAMMB73_Zm00001d018582 [Zea mays]|uniref:Uncharacterized protein n=1 Tax=Zea mays TaxID=4577 RepID=A0A1D6HQG3_MAIZE|nr:hypothetical protein ZEAMMB73_Zm00001d018582 [Zea mays]
MEGPHARTPAGRSLIERTRMEGHRTRMEDADGRSVAKSRDPQPPPLSWTRMECQRSPLRSVNGRQTSLEWTFHPPSKITDASEATGPFISIHPQEFQTPVNPRVPFFSRSILLGRIRFFSRSIALKIPRVANVTVLKKEVPSDLEELYLQRQNPSNPDNVQKEVPSDLEELYLQRQNPRKKSQVILKNYNFNGKIQVCFLNQFFTCSNPDNVQKEVPSDLEELYLQRQNPR